jgi:hypothetical protein
MATWKIKRWEDNEMNLWEEHCEDVRWMELVCV